MVSINRLIPILPRQFFIGLHKQTDPNPYKTKFFIGLQKQTDPNPYKTKFFIGLQKQTDPNPYETKFFIGLHKQTDPNPYKTKFFIGLHKQTDPNPFKTKFFISLHKQTDTNPYKTKKASNPSPDFTVPSRNVWRIQASICNQSDYYWVSWFNLLALSVHRVNQSYCQVAIDFRILPSHEQKLHSLHKLAWRL